MVGGEFGEAEELQQSRGDVSSRAAAATRYVLPAANAVIASRSTVPDENEVELGRYESTRFAAAKKQFCYADGYGRRREAEVALHVVTD